MLKSLYGSLRNDTVFLRFIALLRWRLYLAPSFSKLSKSTLNTNRNIYSTLQYYTLTVQYRLVHDLSTFYDSMV